MKTDQTSRGFTIVELLIVIVVVGILATITMLAYTGIQDRARTASVIASLSQVSNKLAAYSIDNSDNYPTTLAMADINSPSNITYQYAVNNSIMPQTYCVTGTINAISYQVSSTVDAPQSGGCAGHGVGGMSAITNLNSNPRALSGGCGWSANTAATLITKGFAVTGNPNGIVTAAKSQVAAGQSSAIIISMYNVDCLGSSATPRTYGVWVYVNASDYRATVIAGSPTVALVADTWTFIQSSAALTGWSTLYVSRVSGLADPSDYAYATGGIAVAGSTTYNFADGYSANWIWNGTPGASTSTGSPL